MSWRWLFPGTLVRAHRRRAMRPILLARTSFNGIKVSFDGASDGVRKTTPQHHDRERRAARHPWLTGMQKWRRRGTSKRSGCYVYARMFATTPHLSCMRSLGKSSVSPTASLTDCGRSQRVGSGSRPESPKPGPPPIPAVESSTYSECWRWARSTMLSKRVFVRWKTIQALCIKPASSRTKGFFDWFVDHFYDDWVRLTGKKTERELKYTRLGCPA